MSDNLLSWHKRPSGKHNFPVPLFVSRPQSFGNSSSLPVASGDCVPSSVNRPPPPKIFVTGRKMFSTGRNRFRKALKNWPFTAAGPPHRTRKRTTDSAAGVVREKSSLVMPAAWFQLEEPPPSLPPPSAPLAGWVRHRCCPPPPPTNVGAGIHRYI